MFVVVSRTVPRKVLKEKFEEEPDEDEMQALGSLDGDEEDVDYDGTGVVNGGAGSAGGVRGADEYIRESSAFSPSPNVLDPALAAAAAAAAGNGSTGVRDPLLRRGPTGTSPPTADTARPASRHHGECAHSTHFACKLNIAF